LKLCTRFEITTLFWRYVRGYAKEFNGHVTWAMPLFEKITFPPRRICLDEAVYQIGSLALLFSKILLRVGPEF